MNRNILIGILILAVLVSLCTIVTPSMKPNETMKQNESPEMNEKEFPHIPEKLVIASFGLDQDNPDLHVLQNNPDLLNTLINASEADIAAYYYPNGPVTGFGKDMHGSVVVVIENPLEVNQTVIKEIYGRISARGKTYNIDSVPCTFILMGILKKDIAQDTP